ncbi:MAG TPA: sulfotransferase, partial [Xanthomonadales bacterium]|nr:sulfotransferase [Xanthomonadales bacterium]
GAALAMLPQARVVHCRRDALETGWSCFKQFFGNALADFSYDFRSIAGYWGDAERLCAFWAERDPARVHVVEHEALVADPGKRIRALLDACGLPFDDACLRPHEARRAVRSASAMQVRQPLAPRAPRTAAYGPLLDPLREALAAER